MTPEDDEGSVTLWIAGLKAGEAGAAQHLWERDFERLVRLARQELRSLRGRRGVADEEDAALDAFESFCRRASQGQFPQLNDRNDLWRLLMVITLRKVFKQVRRDRAKTRGGENAIREHALAAAPESENAVRLDHFASSEPGPELALMVAHEYQRRLDALSNGTLRRIAVWKMEGYTNAEVAERLGCTQRTVLRKLDLIRQEWSDPRDD